ncbi:MAG: hypothetical protein LBK23_00480 [Oscillospiraceae bacterium]|jgi:hypothetical protein|nr:hypothetical protein [Oscillospiraceae bacterium]
MKEYRKIEGFRIAMGTVAVLSAVYAGFRFLTWPASFQHIICMIAMAMCAIYAFAVYGEKQNGLFGFAAITFAVRYVPYYIRWIPLFFEDIAVLILLADILVGVIFIIIALQYFKKSISKILPIVAIALEILSTIIQSISGFTVDIYTVFNLLYYVPFLLFILFCPSTHKRFKINQKLMTGNVDEQLTYLKNELAYCRITQQEYDYRRKALLDEL